MIGASSIPMMEQNLEILFTILGKKQLMEEVLRKDQYEFYANHMMNYLDLYEKDLCKPQVLVQASAYLLEFYEHVRSTYEGNRSKREGSYKIYSSMMKLILRDPVYIASLGDGQILKHFYTVMNSMKSNLDIQTLKLIYQRLSSVLLRLYQSNGR